MTDIIYAYIGTYTRQEAHVNGQSEGIYCYKMDPDTGNWAAVGMTKNDTNPSFVVVDAKKQCLYAVNEVTDFEDQPGGGVSAYAINQQTGELTLLNSQRTLGDHPCHLSVDPSGKCVFVANYTGGNVSVFPIQADGSLAPASDMVQHVGSSVNQNRQQEPHAHSINLSPNNTSALVCDLGMDKVMAYKIDFEEGKLLPHAAPFIRIQPGAGPRHLAYHPNQKYVYVINEIDLTITVLRYDEGQGHLSEIQNISTLPVGAEGPGNSTADIHVHPNGKFVYGSNRGHNSIASFSIDEATGKLTALGHTPTKGKTPRNFGIDPTGQFLYAANQDSSSIATYRINTETGALTPTGQVLDVPTPVCIHFVQM